MNATWGRSRMRARIAGGSISRTSVPPVLEEPGLEGVGANAARPRDQRPDLAAPDESTPAELDALQAARPRPAADRRRGEVDVRFGEDRLCLTERDPVARRGHASAVRAAGCRRGRRPARGSRLGTSALVARVLLARVLLARVL